MQLITRGKREVYICACSVKEPDGQIVTHQVKCPCKCTKCCHDGCHEKKHPVCFPGDARVQLDNDRFIQVKDLRTGQRVLTGKLINSDIEF